MSSTPSHRDSRLQHLVLIYVHGTHDLGLSQLHLVSHIGRHSKGTVIEIFMSISILDYQNTIAFHTAGNIVTEIAGLALSKAK